MEAVVAWFKCYEVGIMIDDILSRHQLTRSQGGTSIHYVFEQIFHAIGCLVDISLKFIIDSLLQTTHVPDQVKVGLHQFLTQSKRKL